MNIAHLTFDVETYIWNMIYIATTVGILVLATVLKYEATKTSYTLCEQTSTFFDDCIGTRRNTLLMQLLHQKVDLRIFGHFEVHLSRVLSDLQALVNLLMFATQFRN
ncbi:uncharacterized protein LOC108912504 [Anoplophora glabripennis]|uniref:uncharacterized protein LOC108912504 n=1 Tax=Anoplophora glabripennis TaxID=217634 RepID=UPI00087595F0|nr:uncharacterized protein LOC108912504 [Anoplophora glabripennis]